MDGTAPACQGGPCLRDPTGGHRVPRPQEPQTWVTDPNSLNGRTWLGFGSIKANIMNPPGMVFNHATHLVWSRTAAASPTALRRDRHGGALQSLP